MASHLRLYLLGPTAMRFRRTAIRLSVWAGLWGTALVWAINMEAGQILPSFDCTRRVHASAWISAVCAVLALIAGGVSWRSARTGFTGFGSPGTLRFDASLSAMTALIFVFALLRNPGRAGVDRMRALASVLLCLSLSSLPALAHSGTPEQTMSWTFDPLDRHPIGRPVSALSSRLLRGAASYRASILLQ
jgi:hypothetical protein